MASESSLFISEGGLHVPYSPIISITAFLGGSGDFISLGNNGTVLRRVNDVLALQSWDGSQIGSYGRHGLWSRDGLEWRLSVHSRRIPIALSGVQWYL